MPASVVVIGLCCSNWSLKCFSNLKWLLTVAVVLRQPCYTLHLHALLVGIRLAGAGEQAASRHRMEGSSDSHGSDTRLCHSTVFLLSLILSFLLTGRRRSRPAASPPSEKKLPHPWPQ